MPNDNSNNSTPQTSSDLNDPVFPYSSTGDTSGQAAVNPADQPTTTSPLDPATNVNNNSDQISSNVGSPNYTANDPAQSDQALEPAGPNTFATTAPSDPGSVVTSPQTPQKYGGRKVIATIFSVLLLVTAVGVGVYLVQQSVEYRNRAASGAKCDQHPDCILLDEPGNSGSYTAPRNINYIEITAKEYHRFDAQNTDNGCYKVVINGPNLDWQRYGSGKDCKDVSNVQIWLGEAPPPPPPAVTAQCKGVVAYNTAWEMLTPEELEGLKAGDLLRFAVGGNATSGFFDKAKFTVNGQTLSETTNKRPGSEDFYIEYTVPENTTDFNIEAQIHHSSLGWF